MPPPQTRTPLQRRQDLEIAKRQLTFLVSITATIFILCPQCLRIYRNLCIVPVLAWLTGSMFDLINSLSDTWDNAPISGRWYGIVVMTPPVHDYGSLSPDPNTNDRPQPIPWDSHETSSVPPISPTSDFRVHLSFCLVPKTVWESRDTSLAEKLNAGVYWDVRGEYYGSQGEIWSPECVQTVTGIEILGLVDEDQGHGRPYYGYFAPLKQSWNYMKFFWNDVDFAIILGFLVTGPHAAQRTKDLFIRFSRLRIDYLDGEDMARFKSMFATCFATSLATSLATAFTAIGAGPLFVPLPMWFGFDWSGISARDASMWKRRVEECQYLQRRFPQLEGFFEE